MIGDTGRFERAIARFDAANAEDPNRDAADGRDRPRELVYAERMTAMLVRFAPEASEVVRLAARCQHIQRWKIPRADYPPTRVGYHQWRLRLRDFHAELSATILREAGYEDATIGRVRSLIRKEALKTDPEAQMLEDVVDLTFDEAKFVDILQKTGKKMSARGRDAVLAMISPPAALLPVIRKAMTPHGS
jgi:hypothetical protein